MYGNGSYAGAKVVSDGTDVEVLERGDVDVVAGECRVPAGTVLVDDVDVSDVEVEARGTVVVAAGNVGRTTVLRGVVRRGTVCSVTGAGLRVGDDTASGRTST